MKNKKKIVKALLSMLVMLVAVICLSACGKKEEVKEEEVKVDESVDEKIGEEYLNVAVFGVNTVSAKDKKEDSDVIFVVSMNKETKEVKLVPVYGNATLTHDGKEVRAKDVYAEDGAEGSINMLNESLELNIEKYVSVNFEAMADVIDILEGIEIDVKEEEIPHINGYAAEIAKALGKETAVVQAAGVQKLDGAQALAYCRIRVTEGGDVQRNSRQKLVIEQMMKKLTDAKFVQMGKIIDSVFPKVDTNFDLKEMVAYGKDAASYKVESLAAFPRNIEKQKRQEEKEDVQFTDYEEKVVATDMEKDLKDLHSELFGK